LGLDPIDFPALASALLDRARTLVPMWLPGGEIRGHEYVCADLSGGHGSSFSVNLNTGKWGDFSNDEDRGGDLTSLYAAVRGLNNGQAARELMRDLGWERSSNSAPARSDAQASAPRAAAADRPDPPWNDEPPAGEGGGGSGDGPPAGAGKGSRRDRKWRPIVPVPKTAPACDFYHWHYKNPEATWAYEFEGELYGHVARFRTSDGGKEVVPYTWCVDESDGRGTMRWHHMQFPEPRPLYVPATLLSGSPRDVPVVLVEGEKCALAGHMLLPGEFDFVSWPGGGNAWAKANWGWLLGRTVYLWPDCDAKRRKLTREERENNVDPALKEMLPEAMQPGIKAMVNIGSLLVADQACTVLMCPVPKPGAVSDGWDLADAIAEGWDAETVRAFIRGAHAFVPPDDAARAKAATAESTSTPSRAGAAQDQDSQAWRDALIKSGTGAIKAVRENVVLALDGVPAHESLGGPQRAILGIPEAMGVIAFNEFTNDVVKLKPSPWGTPAGVWDEVDDLLMGEWLTREHWLPSMPRGTLEEAVRMVAYRHRYHPVRQEFEALRGTWDGEKRLGTWIRRCCLDEDEWDDADPLHQYLARVGTWLLMGMCARVMTPGCKFDYMVIFEGGQGVGKSTLTRVLGGEYHADTGLQLGDKDSYQNLQGVHVYEFSELDAMSKIEISKTKAFVASCVDRFRASFDRRPKNYPRQVVFVGTVNEDHYLTDSTGNRRFWPVRVTRQVDNIWLRENRQQMLAEAMTYLDAGERFHPTPREERELFKPQQEKRLVENAIESAIARYLYDENQRLSPTGENGTLVNEVTLVGLLSKIGIGLEKLGPGRFHEKQAAAALRRLGWQEARSSDPGRPRLYRRPQTGSPGSQGASGSPGSFNGADAAPSTTRGSDDCPF
jgi:putative DNA primase/helicase